jgi:O-succinylbenzoate synthase
LKVEKVVLTRVRVPLVEPFRISSGAVSERDVIVVALHSEGLTGYGESSPMGGGFYSSDTPEGSWEELCEAVIPAVLGRTFEGPADWNGALDKLSAGNFTKTGVETAFWDLQAQRQNKPLHEILGGTAAEVRSGLAVGLYDDLDDMLRTVSRYLTDGYHRIKLKIEPGRDIEVVKAARKQFGNIPMFVDANCAYSMADVDIFRALDEFDLMMFEQPFPKTALEDLAELQRQVRTPICLDESLDNVEQLTRAIRLKSFRIANFKIQRIGGFHKALEMVDVCRTHQIPAWVGTMPELGIGQAQGAALASLSDFVFPTDVEASARWYRDDIISPFLEVRNGNIKLPTTPGLGYGIDQKKLQKYKIATRSFPA